MKIDIHTEKMNTNLKEFKVWLCWDKLKVFKVGSYAKTPQQAQ